MVGKILIVDDVSTNRIVFKVKLSAAGYAVVVAGDGLGCLHQARTERPDVILLDLNLPDMNGIDVLGQLKANPATRRIPVVMVSSEQDPVRRVAALRAGAEDFLSRPIDDEMLLARLRGLLRSRESIGSFATPEAGFGLFGMAEAPVGFDGPGLVALVMPRAEAAVHLRKQLAAAGSERITILAPDEVHVAGGPDLSPDVYLIDSDVNGEGGGLRLMSELLSRSASRHAAFCILNQSTPHPAPAMALDLGANDVVDSRIPPSELAVRLHRLVLHKREMERMRASVQDGLRLAMIDPLTGLHNRRYGMAQLQAIAGEAEGAGSDFAVMVVDLDRFKSVNDRWGHAAGDAVLIEISARLAANLRDTDLLARIGGEEFLIVLPDTSLEDAGLVARRLCQAAVESPVVLADGTSIDLTISIGMTLGQDGANVADLVDRADRALMRSKAGGRNKVTILNRAA
jgi:two-component system, cell cycle response regulator